MQKETLERKLERYQLFSQVVVAQVTDALKMLALVEGVVGDSKEYTAKDVSQILMLITKGAADVVIAEFGVDPDSPFADANKPESA